MPRKRQSKAIRDAKGNPGKRAPAKRPRAGAKTTKAHAPAVDTKPADLAAAPKVPGGIPRELTKHGKAVWNMVAPQLLKSKLLHPADRISLTRYCDTVAEYWKVMRELREKDYTYEAEKVGSGKMLRFNPLFMVQARHPLVSVRGPYSHPSFPPLFRASRCRRALFR